MPLFNGKNNKSMGIYIYSVVQHSIVQIKVKKKHKYLKGEKQNFHASVLSI